MREKILSVIESPKELEMLYQENPGKFQRAFQDIFAQRSDSIILQVWNERLIRVTPNDDQQKFGAWHYKSVLLVVLLSLIAGTLLRLPTFFENIDSIWFNNRNLAGIFIVPLMIYFLFYKPQSKRMVLIVLILTVGAWLYLAFLPNENAQSFWASREKYRSFEDAIALAELHVPLFLWLLLGMFYIGKNWRVASDRMNFLRYNGEVIVYTTMIVIGGMILTGITLALLTLINYKFSNWYVENIIPYGIAAAPLVGTFLIDKIIERRLNIAPILARIFIPLFLVTTIAYLVIMSVSLQSPFNDREYLMAFNILLIVVLGLLIFSIAERDLSEASGFSDYMNVGLVLTTLVIDLVALFAILFRVATDVYGLTPNRIAILGINILVFCHLVGILVNYIRFVMKKDSFVKLETWIVAYLPAYAIWSLVISIALPLFFWYR